MNITGGKYNSLKINTADFENIKPTLSKIRQAVFNTLSSMTDFNGELLFCDLFAGSGIMTFEAVSRGFKTISVEKDRKSFGIIKENSKKTNIPIDIICGDAIKFLKTTDKKFDVIYIDPPYLSDLYKQALDEISSKKLLNKDGILVIEKPVKVFVDTSDFKLIKEKKYSDKEICYYKNLNL